ncbi:UvrD-helicase domain-containing protein [Patescibacteria group bacterium]|nr:UvrD-helicase domain-containing protein [Patescibacteria group bacterium]MBU4512034.1 UvrD-helicase domain-containing protein [Patescibacteria group bacterium]MCG2693189.1 UvrD-helicase domain-containing protein [Candidatus Parcubacteria bacterium]
MNNILSNLNPEQKKAVIHEKGPLLIVAGAGTGKTTVITRRIAWLIEQKKAKADEILALTFTDKASEEMEERVDKLLPYGYVDLWISTFHSFCERILKAHGLDIGLSTDFKLLTQTDQWLLIRQNLEKFKLDYYRPLGNPTKFIQALITHFSRLKDEEVWPEEYLEYAEKLRLDAGARIEDGGVKAVKKSEIRNPKSETNSKLQISNFKTDDSRIKPQAVQASSDVGEIVRIEEVAGAYHTYQQLLHENNYLDFGDLINYTLKLFRTRKNLLTQFQKQFKYILVDEFQDTNWAQYDLVKLLAGEKKNITVVGDDDQCLPPDSIIKTKDGNKKIKNVKTGDLIVSAIGRGLLSYKRVSKVIKNRKKSKFITFTTKSGHKIRVTDNHKMFCLIPAIDDHKYHYVYLMNRQDLGWRIGITNDLSTRLRLERSADKIIAIKSCNGEEEARYYEILYSLKYNIPTICFKDRKGIVAKNKWIARLFYEINTENNVNQLAKDLNIDITAHHYCLDTVNRGDKVRLKINLELCYRKYRSKYAKENYLDNPQVSHILFLETSDSRLINKLKANNYNLSSGRKGGYRLRICSKNFSNIGREAIKLKQITGGIIEQSFKLGKINRQTQKALIIPAKNVFVGQYLPIISNNSIVYDRVVKREESKIKNTVVYDLEIADTHNFIADNVVVHNSIYKFRGASLSNILQFEKDFPESSKVVLTKNYRSCQNILDVSYKFIQLNNPNRLEVALSGGSGPLKSSSPVESLTRTEGGQTFARPPGRGISKKLQSQTACQGEIQHLHAQTSEEEVQTVIKKIIDFRNKSVGVDCNQPLPQDEKTTWSDFAILVRANSSADAFCRGLAQAQIPYQFLASKGLYTKPVIMDVLAYFKLLDNYHESAALYRMLNSPIFKISPADQSKLTYQSYKTAESLYECLQKIAAIPGISEESVKKASRLLSFIEKHSDLAREKNIGELYVTVIKDLGYEQYLVDKDDQWAHEQLNYLNQFYKRIQKFEAGSLDPKLRDFMLEINLEIEAGEQGKLAFDVEAGPDMVKIMTIHGAKGLEFKYVFIANLVDKRFPTIQRADPIQIPDELVKEILPEGDIHLEEERRLFYVAMTRAKQGLYFTSADDYGGARVKKMSRFLFELGLEKKSITVRPRAQLSVSSSRIRGRVVNYQLSIINKDQKSNPHTTKFEPTQFHLPNHFSYSQLAAFKKCPRQYKFNFILHIPVYGKAPLSFGRTMHTTLQKFFAQNMNQSGQNSLFGDTPPIAQNDTKLPPLSDLLKLYEKAWIDDWYESKTQKQEYKEKGKKILKDFYTKIEKNPPVVDGLETNFNLRIGDYTVRGRIDRLDKTGDGVELIDYKTGSPKEKLINEDKEQLLIYQIACEEVLGKKPLQLTYWYLEGNQPVSFLGADKEKEKLKKDILTQIEGIRKSDFKAAPGWQCKFCDFREICEERAE